MRLTLRTYSILSVVATAGIVYHAYSKYEQFYPSGVYLATAKHSLLVFANMLLILAYLLGKLVVYLYLDKVQERESEYVSDRLKSSITDTILALTIFRDHFNAQFVFLFLLLLFFQVFHWLTKNRVEYIEHTPYNFINQCRLCALLLFLLAGDLAFIYYASLSLMKEGPNVMILFGLEFGLLIVTNVSTLITLFINIEGIKREGRWDNKGLYILYLEFVTESIKSALYLIFFFVTIFYNYGLPIHIIRQIFISLKTSIRRFNDIRKYRNITNERFADATEEELANTDRICIVCREDMTHGKKLPCGHILHLSCLRSWLERQQSCPICRADVLAEPPVAAAAAAAQQPQQQQAQPAVGAVPAQAAQPQQEAAQNFQPINPALLPPLQPFRHQMHMNPLLREMLLQNRNRGLLTNNNNNNNNQPNLHNENAGTQQQSQHGLSINTNQLINQVLQQNQQLQQRLGQVNNNNNNSTTSGAGNSEYNPLQHLMFIQQHLQYLCQQTELLSLQLSLNPQWTNFNQSQHNTINNNNINNNNNKSTKEEEEKDDEEDNSTSTSTTTTATTTTSSINSKEHIYEGPAIESYDDDGYYSAPSSSTPTNNDEDAVTTEVATKPKEELMTEKQRQQATDDWKEQIRQRINAHKERSSTINNSNNSNGDDGNQEEEEEDNQ